MLFVQSREGGSYVEVFINGYLCICVDVRNVHE